MEKIPQNQTDVPVAETKAEEQKLECGLELEQTSWYGAQEKIVELNKNLEKGEKPWRLPTEDELVAEFKKTGSTPVGFQKKCYWSSDMSTGGPDSAYLIDMNDGDSGSNDKSISQYYLARFVR